MKLSFSLLITLIFFLTYHMASAQEFGSLNFNGKDNYVEIRNSPLNQIGTGDFTLEAWISGEEHHQSAHPMIFSNRGTDEFGGGILFFFHSRWGGSRHKLLCLQLNAINYLIRDNGSFEESILDGQCHHVAVVRENNVLSFYIDGNHIGDKIPQGLINVSFNGPLLIGKDKATNNTFDGFISQCRIWDVARTEEEIRGNYKLSLEGNEDGLIAYWELNNEGSQEVIDKTNQYNGVLGSSNFEDQQDPLWSTEGCILKPEDITIQNDQCDFLVSPNPTDGNIQIGNPDEFDLMISVIDVSGRKILESNYNSSIITLDLRDFASGTYFVRICNEEQFEYHKVVLTGL